jgi:hypothetical protein
MYTREISFWYPMSIAVKMSKKLMWANENEMPTPKMALSKGVIMLGSVPSQYTVCLKFCM